MAQSNPLTHLETRVLAAIEQHIRAEGMAPTIAELAAELRLKSKGTVHRYVQSLIAKGRLVRQGRGWRGLRIVGFPMPDQRAGFQRLPPPQRAGALTFNQAADTESLSHSGSEIPIPATAECVNNVSQLEYLPVELDKADPDRHTRLRIPLLGKIAAGQPIEAIEDSNYLDLAAFFIGPDRYALRVSGDSMMDAGILDGDTVILRKQETAQPGDIVVALIDGNEATLKRLGSVANGEVELIPENQSMPVMRYSQDRVRFQGILVGQLRSY